MCGSLKIKDFIQKDVLLPRLRQDGVLVVYDPDQRYRELCLELSAEKLCVIDVSESSITSRFAALDALSEFGKANPSLEGILVYIPAEKPITDEEKQREPFAVYGAIGSVFPEGDGEEYISLCLRARADHATEIRKIFKSNPQPSFETIDAIGGGVGWPILQSALKAESTREILLDLLMPSETQIAALKTQYGWISEAKELFKSALGLNLITKLRSWSSISEELWRFILFSEFVFDLPGALPSALTTVPIAPDEAESLINDLCDRLRNNIQTQDAYIERAEEIERELNLSQICLDVEDFGVRDTFPFEERASFNQAVLALQQENYEKPHETLERHEQSIWIRRGESQAQWTLLRSAVDLALACEDIDRQLPDNIRSIDSLLDFYTNSIRRVDRFQREFEQAAGHFFDLGGTSDDVISLSRATYRKVIDKAHQYFISHIEKSGWPLMGRLLNGDVFDNLVAPKLIECGRRVAYFMIDAMRYELGVEFAKQLNEFGQIDVQIACAQLPTITSVGMASLLPEASRNIRVTDNNDQVLILHGESPLSSVSQRMDVFRRKYGQRFSQIELTQFVRYETELEPTVELLVIRSNDLDNDFESTPEAAPGLISRTFQKIRSAISKLRDLGFQDIIIATDHGFFLNTATSPGDICSKPAGKWINVHERAMLGDGVGDAANLVMATESLGIKGDFSQLAVPRALVAYRAGQMYFHGGLSLQESIVPVISLRIRPLEPEIGSQLNIRISYKKGNNKTTTRVPVISVEAFTSELFAKEAEILIEAYDMEGNVVGEAKHGGVVNQATRIITMRAGDSISVTLKMDLDFEGKFIVKALDPITQTTLGEPLILETDYTV